MSAPEPGGSHRDPLCGTGPQPAASEAHGHDGAGSAESHALRHTPGRSGHDHGIGANADTRSLATALALIVGFLVVEVVVALASGSVALLADAGHMLSDAGAIAGSLWAIRLAARPATGDWTFGFKRAEILSAAVNGITLLVVGILVGIESVERLFDPPAVDGGPVLAVALLGVAVNVAATWVLSRANRGSLNVEGAFQHIVTDLYAFIGTVIAAIVILTTGYVRADAIASLIVVGLMLHSAWCLLRDSGRVLLEAAPKTVALADVREHMLEVPEILGVHDLHVWTVTSDLPALSAHVVIDDACFTNGRSPMILDHLQECLQGHFDVEHSTFQLEPASHLTHEAGHHS
jgi:cobalt-zinc-cadmium efflux system protein